MKVETVTDLPVLPRRQPESNKGNYGRILVIAGSRGMSGAAVLCGSAALRAGAGLVRVAVAEGILPIVAASNPCYMTVPLTQDDDGRIAGEALAELRPWIAQNDVLAVGPGLGKSHSLSRMLRELLAETQLPIVLDADGLTAFADQPADLIDHAGPVVITPHPGEFARLLKADVPTVQAHRAELAAKFARDHRLVVVLKGHGTVVTDGTRSYVNKTGNPGMATAGAGDVLTGVIAALIGQRLDPFAAAQLGVYLHGLAGDLVCEARGEVGLIASDIVEAIPESFRKWRMKPAGVG
ncbi:MAG: NAD(P)H-hydrate dehydratase [Planctomycetes bacterium]|nr:NAD(P)H-hydrate dehydratase [Planctomycetota bacterium]